MSTFRLHSVNKHTLVPSFADLESQSYYDHVVIVVKLCYVEGLMEDLHLISTLVNKSLY